ncbi:conserved membrane hypothetical protein [Tenacibaculum maritimum]|nr:conserved membrane hypothetical protein [Tenacibaculum maritimum]
MSSQTKTYSFIAAILICIVSFIPYIHDFNYFKGMKGFSGFKSLRVGIWVVSMFLFGLFGWILAFINSKGKEYRFTILAPISMGLFQFFIYVLDSRKSSMNNFNFKVIFNVIFILIITISYFRLKKNE